MFKVEHENPSRFSLEVFVADADADAFGRIDTCVGILQMRVRMV
jgi:hypothetical protein